MAGRQQRRRQWERRVARWRASGLSMAAYCRRHGLSYWMFVRWRQRIERTVTPASPLTLIPVAFPTPSGGAITIRLRDGIGIEVEPGFARHVIGEEVSEKLDIEPARMTVLQYRRKKYACRACEGEVQSAPLPAQVIEQGLATPGLLAHVAVQKFCDHMPLARQSKFFDRHRIELPRSTLTDWMLALGLITQPLVERMGELLKTLDILGSDDTPMPWQNERVGKTTTARLWVWRGVIDASKPLLLYQFTRDRSGEHAAKFLEGWRGYLQADAYSGYDRNFVGGHIIEVGCMAHARRRYFEIAKNAKTPGFAQDIVQRIAELYAIEREAKERNLSPSERQRLRQERAPPLLDALKERLEGHLPKVPPKGRCGVGGVVLAVLAFHAIRSDEVGRNQPSVQPQRA
jgi:transposase